MGDIITVLIVIAAVAALAVGIIYGFKHKGGCKCGCDKCSNKTKCHK